MLLDWSAQRARGSERRIRESLQDGTPTACLLVDTPGRVSSNADTSKRKGLDSLGSIGKKEVVRIGPFWDYLAVGNRVW